MYILNILPISSLFEHCVLRETSKLTLRQFTESCCKTAIGEQDQRSFLRNQNQS